MFALLLHFITFDTLEYNFKIDFGWHVNRFYDLYYGDFTP